MTCLKTDCNENGYKHRTHRTRRQMIPRIEKYRAFKRKKEELKAKDLI